MRRILIVGSGGAGKSTLATQIGERLNLPVIHLDAHYWRCEWAETVQAFVEQDAWVMDGNYGGTLDQRLETADTVIFLDLPRMLCLFRVVKRRVMYHGRTRPDMTEGCPERLDAEFLKWIWNYPRDNRPRLLSKLEAVGVTARVVVLRSRSEVQQFVNELAPGSPDHLLQSTGDARE